MLVAGKTTAKQVVKNKLFIANRLSVSINLQSDRFTTTFIIITPTTIVQTCL